MTALIIVCTTVVVIAGIFGWAMQRLQSIQAQGMLAAFQAGNPASQQQDRTVVRAGMRANSDLRVPAHAD
jgi:hypothetical protein